LVVQQPVSIYKQDLSKDQANDNGHFGNTRAASHRPYIWRQLWMFTPQLIDQIHEMGRFPEREIARDVRLRDANRPASLVHNLSESWNPGLADMRLKGLVLTGSLALPHTSKEGKSSSAIVAQPSFGSSVL
jgi:hypothetical protein